MDTQELIALKEKAGPVGPSLADGLTTRVTEALNGFPHSDNEQKAAIARLIAHNLGSYADDITLF